MTRSILRVLVSLPLLQSLTLHTTTCNDSDEVHASDLNHEPCNGGSITALDVDSYSVLGLCQLGLPAACPNVQKLSLTCFRAVPADRIQTACTSFPHITELRVQAKFTDEPPSMCDPVSFCDAVVSSCPRLIKLTMSRIELGNNMAAEILRGMMMAHTSLKSISIKNCDTDEKLDEHCEQINKERRIAVSLQHGRLIKSYHPISVLPRGTRPSSTSATASDTLNVSTF